MTKIGYILKESFYMIRKHKIYFLAPILIILAILALIVFYIGPSVIISFIYAGV
jgi:hypothetical protein